MSFCLDFAGILQGVTIDRAGNFSCPVASGMVFAASMKCRGSTDPGRIAEIAALEFAASLTNTLEPNSNLSSIAY